MFRKGCECFHPDYGNGVILRVNKQGFAKIDFQTESEPVWIPVNKLDDPLSTDDNIKYIEQLELRGNFEKFAVTENEIREERAKARSIKYGKPFKIKGLDEYLSGNKPDKNDEPARTKRIEKSESTSESIGRFENEDAEITGPEMTPVYPVSLRNMPMPAPDVPTFCQLFSQCISAEIYAVRSRYKITRLLIHHAECVQMTADSCVYCMELDSDVFYPEGSAVTIWETRNASEPYGTAVVASCDNSIILLETQSVFSDDISGMYYSVDEAGLLEALNERLDEISQTEPSPILEELIVRPLRYIRNHPIQAEQLGQNNAFASALSQPITFIWGPPGTGKTETLAKIALEYVSLGHRVLLLSQCNVSVDAAILRVNQLDKNRYKGQCVRYGYPKAPELVENTALTVSMMALEGNSQMFDKRDSLMRELRKTPHTSPRYLEIRKELESINEQLLQAEKILVRKASFVATTVSKAVIDKTLYKDSKFDVVMFDEASMALIPQIVFAASLAKAHFICAGDFCQLPPIVRADNSALEADIYLYTGISNSVYRNQCHAWLYMLDTQYRMHSAIANFASRFMYRGLLKNADVTLERQNIASCRPVSGEAVVLLNLVGSHTFRVDSSKINLMSALMSFGTALNIVSQNHSVGIITPYNPQSRLLRCMAKDFALQENETNRINCSTVHQFQGSEKDIILYDVAENRIPGIMLSKCENNYANRLFNVAMTRARGKLCIMADKEFVHSRMSDNLMLSGIVNQYYRHCVNIRKDFASSVCTFPFGIMRTYQNETLYEALDADIDNTSSTIRMIASQEFAAELNHVGIIGKIIDKNALTKIKLNLRVPDPSLFGMHALLFAKDNQEETLFIFDKSILWYLYRPNPDSIAGIRFKGFNTVRRIQFTFFNKEHK